MKAKASAVILAILWLTGAATAYSADRPNVIFIICDDLNDYIEGYGGHPQTRTPNMARLAESGVRFTQAHCNAPICAPSRASLFTGIYPHHSGCYGFTKWDTYQVLQNSRTMQEHFEANGYHTLGTGKLMHHRVVQRGWQQYGNPADYGPFAFAAGEKIAHPDVPAPYREIGPVDGSFGPFVSLAGRNTPDGHPLGWHNGGWGKQARELRVDSQEDRDQTPDEINGDWAVANLRRLAKSANEKPFFMGIGFIRPHTPLIVPQRFFDMFPLEEIQLPVIRPGDVDDTHARSIRGIPNGEEPTSTRTEDMGLRLYSNLVASYPTSEEALRRFIQAYLASVASVDQQIGRILDVVDNSPLKENTIIILTSDHGWGMGEKDYLYKNSLWQESTQVPLIVRAPGIASADSECDQPVSLIDLYPTLVDLCDLNGETMKNDKGHPLDGHSFKPLLSDPEAGTWPGPDEALTTLYKWRMQYDPLQESYSLRSKNWRYIRYENGKEELYDTVKDPYEWDNLADRPEHADRLQQFRQRLQERLPKPGMIPPQPAWQPKNSNNPDISAEVWKDRYFAKHAEADANKDGTLTWSELRAFREQPDSPPLASVSAKESHVRWLSGTHKLVVDGVEREFILDIPKELKPGSVLVWVFHGYTGSAASMRDSAEFKVLFEKHGFAVVYPQGTCDSKGNTFFNVGYAFHRDQQVDDVRFVRELTDRLVTDLKIDRRAVFATGMSNGGDMSFFLASREDPIVRAIAPVSGTMMQSWSDGFVPATRVPVLAVHGTADTVTKWEGDLENRDGWGSYFGVEAVLELWTRGMRLESKAITEVLTADDEAKPIELHHWTTAKDRMEVQFYKIIGGGHEWPSDLGDPQRSTASVIWDFFRSHLPHGDLPTLRSDGG